MKIFRFIFLCILSLAMIGCTSLPSQNSLADVSSEDSSSAADSSTTAESNSSEESVSDDSSTAEFSQQESSAESSTENSEPRDSAGRIRFHLGLGTFYRGPIRTSHS